MGSFELLDAKELADRLRLPVTWVQEHTRARTPRTQRIPCWRAGRYVRFHWGSPELSAWIESLKTQ
jgi:hypothetical protein